MKMKKTWVMAIAVTASLTSFAFATNYWELRDGSNVTQVTIDGTKQLISALLNASDLNRGTVPNARLDSSSVTLQGNAFNGVSELVQLDGTGALPAISGANLTNLNASSLTSGTVPNARLDSTSVTLQGNTFNGNNQLVQLNGSGALPSLSGANLTSLNASQLTSGTVPNARLDSTSVTLQGNMFNGISQLIQTTGTGKYPALDGSLITNIMATSVAASSVTAGTFQAAPYTFPSTTTVNGLAIFGAMSATTLHTAACPSGFCVVLNTSDFDLYTATATSAGSWRNSRTGVAP